MAFDLYLYMSMRLFCARNLIRAAILSILWTMATPSAALSETRAGEDSYVRLEHQFVLSTKTDVRAMCEPGDVVVNGSCEGRSEEFHVWLDSNPVNENGRNGWSCHARVVRADQELRITAAVTCKKSGEARTIKNATSKGGV